MLLQKETRGRGVANSEDPTCPASHFCLGLTLANPIILAQPNESTKITCFPAIPSWGAYQGTLSGFDE